IRYSTLEVSIYMYLRVLLDFDSALSLTILQILFISSVSLLTGIFSSRTTLSAGKTVKERFPLWGYLYSFVAVVIVFLPLSMSIVGGFVNYGGGFTLNNFRNLFSSALRYVLGVTPLFTIVFTMALALFTAILTLTIAFFSSYSSVREKQRLSSVVCFVPTAVSAATIAFGLVMLSRVASLPIPFLLIVVYTLISLPIVHGMMENAWRNTPVEIEEAASLDGAGLFSMLFRIRFPMMRKEILGSLAFASAISIGEMTATIILSEPPFTTMSVLTYRLLSTRHLPEAQAMNSILAWIVLGLFFIVETAGSEH
ncbi:MAG: iron ABC transporter permease, partial [Thermotogae bacterium]